ncbi:hypothetical protein Nepgr_007917 [Nepenthes gracilis]|uniref:Uncharacterized protein n=1 Tax=Nepenthes gracilis TaxID=150966 RepID=A0AAD3S8M4_NEPGR|nr:hypothetical protein Nepgr_007917 [Nepenthes gracilis]
MPTGSTLPLAAVKELPGFLLNGGDARRTGSVGLIVGGILSLGLLVACDVYNFCLARLMCRQLSPPFFVDAAPSLCRAA